MFLSIWVLRIVLFLSLMSSEDCFVYFFSMGSEDCFVCFFLYLF